jgi:peptidyl-prolyl cis-trans isomerase A (cyclophilin A)
VRGTISFAQFKPTDRTSNVFINLRDNPNLDTLGFAPIGRVTQGMEAADSLFANYGELPSSDPPLGNPKRLYAETNKYLDEKYPKLDRIIKITIRP